ncbi:MAG: hypothetical protein WA990_12750 [Rubrobacteraceae bacterium]
MKKIGQALPGPASLTLGLLTIVTIAVAAIFVWGSGGAKVDTLDAPTVGEARISIPVYEAAEVAARPASGMRIGSFEPPARAPEYEILEEKPVDDEDARAVRLLVDTQARGEGEYVLISRDIKARYADYDAVSVEFTDTEDLLDYKGGALIFNTPEGATYMGFIYGPPNTKGYYVRATD